MAKGLMGIDGKIRIWTICHAETFHQLEKQGELLADLRRVDDDYASAYRWMTAQVNQRLGTRIKTPWWGWHSWGKRNGRPDLRYGAHLPRRTESILLELMLNNDEVVLSQFDMWNMSVLNGDYLPGKSSEFSEYSLKEKRIVYPRRPTPTAREVRASWKGIFDLKFGSVHCWGRYAERWIQACYPVLRRGDVVSTRYFVAK